MITVQLFEGADGAERATIQRNGVDQITVLMPIAASRADGLAMLADYHVARADIATSKELRRASRDTASLLLAASEVLRGST